MNLRLSILAFIRKHKFVLYHILAWLLYISFAVFYRVVLGSTKSVSILGSLLTALPNIYVFYFAIAIFFIFLDKRKILGFFFAEAGFFLTYLLFYYFVNEVLSPLLFPRNDFSGLKLGQFVMSGFWVFLNYSYFAFGYYLAMRSIRRERQMAAIAQEK